MAVPDLVFIDINMAPFTGDKCLKELRNNYEFEKTIIAMFLTFIPRALEEALIASDADFAIEKPARYEAFRNVIKRVITDPSMD